MKWLRSFSSRWLSRGPVQQRYAFILCPPYCGSTLMSQILASSKNVSINNPEGTCEGQTLPQVREHLFVENRWDENLQIDWPLVKRVWETHWDTKKPVLLEKSPPNILRAKQIEAHFEPAFFFAMWRNPYAHCESQIRRNRNSPREAAGFAVRCLNLQRRNIEQLDQLLPISYEQLTNDPDSFVQLANSYLPQLGSMRIKGSFNIHNMLGRELDIQNLNREKIAALSIQELTEINSVLRDNLDTLDYFDYGLIN